MKAPRPPADPHALRRAVRRAFAQMAVFSIGGTVAFYVVAPILAAAAP